MSLAKEGGGGGGREGREGGREGSVDPTTPLVLQDLKKQLSISSNESDDENVDFDLSAIAIPVAAMNALLGVVERSHANTMMGLQEELEQACMDIQESSALLDPNPASQIALASGCELFLRYITRTFLELEDFSICRDAILERGKRFTDISLAARDRIAKYGHGFVQDGSTILIHGWSRVVAKLLLKAASTNKHFDLVVLEGRPDAAGAQQAARFYSQSGIPVTIVLDAAMGYVMERVDLVLLGAEGVVENGGIVNKIGTNALATVARAHDVPVYVAAESYKFARLYPLSQQDVMSSSIGSSRGGATTGVKDTTAIGDVGKNNDDYVVMVASSKTGKVVKELPSQVKVENPLCDYTPAKYITLLFTDLGVLTPSAVSDELIRLYQ